MSKQTEEHKEKNRKAHLGKKYKPMSEEGKKNISIAQKRRKPISEETRVKLQARVKSEKTRKKMSESQKLRKENHNFWKGGITPINQKIRGSLEYKLWRESVFKRDNFTCIWCGVHGGKRIGKIVLNADHIKPFAYFPELRFAIDNGRTLCIDCHKTTKSYLNRWSS